VVNRVRLGRRDDGRRRLTWAGPPPLLLLATVLGLVVAPAVADDSPAPTGAAISLADGPHRGAAATPRSIEPRIVRQVQSLSRGGQAAGTVAPVQPAIDVIGVASMNLLQTQPVSAATADALRLTGRPDVDVIGWQEAQNAGGALHNLPGWTTATFPENGGFSELAVSWRTQKFKFVAARVQDAIAGVGAGAGRYPFGSRQIAVVTLEHRASGRRLTVLDAHLPPVIEDLTRPGRFAATENAEQARSQLRDLVQAWRSVDTRWVVGTGDFNFDARADLEHHTLDGPVRTLGRVARSTYQVVGTGQRPTYPSLDRSIDYVWLDKDDLRSDRVDVLGQRVPTGYNSDHRPLLARLRLS
jgi:endonuclease/exonuclease/phosphatase family metal-dependent hydrolase